AAQPLWYGFWALGIATALLTAFYMTRLMLYTFHGPNRTGEKERAHLHEVPNVMTAPLAVLGLLTLFGGALNVPHLFGGHARLERWLEPITHGATMISAVPEMGHATEWLLVVVAVAVAAAGIVAAWRLLPLDSLVPARAAAPETGLGRLLWKKFYVDE